MEKSGKRYLRQAIKVNANGNNHVDSRYLLVGGDENNRTLRGLPSSLPTGKTSDRPQLGDFYKMPNLAFLKTIKVLKNKPNL